MRVLIIDDHALFRVGLQELLTRRNITVIDAVGDGAEGIRLAIIDAVAAFRGEAQQEDDITLVVLKFL